MADKFILAADDDVEFHYIMKTALEESGFTGGLCMVSDGIRVMDFLKHRGKFGDSQTPDLIIMDLNMPYKSGREALQEIKSDPGLSLIPIVLLSSSVSEEDLQLSRDFGCLFIQKPDSFAGWIRAMQSALESIPSESAAKDPAQTCLATLS
jgi:CheY-like chemotaxis protein